MPPRALGTVVTVAGLVLAAWCLVPVLRDRRAGRTHWAGAVLLEALVVAQVAVVIWHLAGGTHPRQYLTFVGYLVALLITMPLAGVLARLEPTRWGALILAIGAVVVPVLVLRLGQLWSGGA
jgi:hypothetical protein